MVYAYVFPVVVLLALLNVFNRYRTYKSLDRSLNQKKWSHLSNEEYVHRVYNFIAARFSKVNGCWVKYPWRNFFYRNVWKMKGKGIPCHMYNFFLQRALRRKMRREEFRTKITKFFSQGILIHFYSKVRLKKKWVDVDVWGKQWGIPFGKNMRNTKGWNTGFNWSMIIVAVVFIGILLLVSSCAPATNHCESDLECVPDACCHASGAVNKEFAPNCTNVICTMECAPGTIDCGQGEIKCIENRCEVVLNE